jgi:hypothetical protein
MSPLLRATTQSPGCVVGAQARGQRELAVHARERTAAREGAARPTGAEGQDVMSAQGRHAVAGLRCACASEPTRRRESAMALAFEKVGVVARLHDALCACTVN